MKKASTWTLRVLAIAIVAIVGGMVLLAILGKFRFGAEFYFAGCEGDIEGQRCFSISGCGTPLSEDEELVGIANPRCTIYSDDKFTCENAYGKIKKDEREISFCVWREELKAQNKSCLINPEIGCEDLSQDTKPRCQDVPRCRPVSQIKKAMQSLKPG